MLSEVILAVVVVVLVVDRIVQTRLWAVERKHLVAALIANNAAEYRYIAETEVVPSKNPKTDTPALTQVGI